MDKLKPCPFCGGAAKIVLCDDEGNLHDEDYALRPYSGVGFMIRHTNEENPECPIARYEVDGGIVGGVYIYDAEERAAEAWNRRVNDALVHRGFWAVRHTKAGKPYTECTRCGTDFSFRTDKGTIAKLDMRGMLYCPHCGALMDGGNDNG